MELRLTVAAFGGRDLVGVELLVLRKGFLGFVLVWLDVVVWWFVGGDFRLKFIMLWLSFEELSDCGGA